MKKYYFSIVIFIITLIIPACTEKEAVDTTGNIEGIVRDFGTQLSLQGVIVDIESNSNATFVKQSMETGSDGKFGFNDIEAGNYSVSFMRSGYTNYTKEINVPAGQTVSCDAILQINPDFGIVNGVLTTYYGKENNVVIPENVGIVSIGNSVFKNNLKLVSIVIPEGVTVIGNGAFEGCENLVSAAIPSTITDIGEDAFHYCYKLSSINIPDGVITIGNYAFAFCSALASVNIPNSVTTIGMGTFGYCNNLTAITVGSGLTIVDRYSFTASGNLLSFTVDSENKSYMSEDGVLFNKAKTKLIRYPPGKSGIYTIPNTVTSINTDAFTSSKLTSVTLGNSVAEIGDGVFFNCYQLTSFIVNNENMHYMSDDGVLFNKTKTALVRYPEGKSGEEYAIPHTVTSIEYEAVAACRHLTAVTIPGSVTFIDKYAFYACANLTNVTVGRTTPPNISVNDNIFKDVPLSTATLHVPAGTKATYEAANVWKEFGNIVEY
jgi:hypothetical protein